MQKVIGQTGTTVLSDEKIQYRLDKKRTVRYNYQKLKLGWLCQVIGPFHSKLYGACSFGTKKTSAKSALERNLSVNYGYIGKMMFSDVDEADKIGGRVYSDDDRSASPISTCVAVGSAGM